MHVISVLGCAGLVLQCTGGGCITLSLFLCIVRTVSDLCITLQTQMADTGLAT